MGRALLFDIGNVLVHFDFAPAAGRLAELSTVSAAEIQTLLAPLKIEHESGRISDETFVSRAISRIGFRGAAGKFSEIWSDIFTENAPMTALVKKLSGCHPLYLFSNTSGLHKEWFTTQFEVFSHFGGGIFSHEVRAMKPDEAFYRAAMSRFDLDPAQTFYIDDLAENIAVGRRLGFVTHHYDASKHAALEEKAERWLSSS